MDIKWIMFLCFLGAVAAVDSNCDYKQSVTPGETYYIYSPRYPDKYAGALNCRWKAECPTGYNCRLDCPDISLPSSSGCMLDRLLISKNGDPDLARANTYCGRGSVSAVSIGRKISIVFLQAKDTVRKFSDAAQSLKIICPIDDNSEPIVIPSKYTSELKKLKTSRSTSGGKFMCELRAQPAAANTTCSCGVKKRSRIMGGEESGANEFTMMAGLASVRDAQIKCGAVIISNQTVLTAAHCLAGEDKDSIIVIVGEHDVTTGTDTEATRAYKVDSFKIHPMFDKSSLDYDIALIKVRRMINFNDEVGPVCLPFKFMNKDFTGEKITILGWGAVTPESPNSRVLRQADVNVISQTQCMYNYTSLTDREICTYAKGKAACQHDAGGPLLYTDPATGLLFNVGIVSHGKSCASGYPGVNTRVTKLLQWITSNTGDMNYCNK